MDETSCRIERLGRRRNEEMRDKREGVSSPRKTFVLSKSKGWESRSQDRHTVQHERRVSVSEQFSKMTSMSSKGKNFAISRVQRYNSLAKMGDGGKESVYEKGSSTLPAGM